MQVGPAYANTPATNNRRIFHHATARREGKYTFVIQCFVFYGLKRIASFTILGLIIFRAPAFLRVLWTARPRSGADAVFYHPFLRLYHSFNNDKSVTRFSLTFKKKKDKEKRGGFAPIKERRTPLCAIRLLPRMGTRIITQTLIHRFLDATRFCFPLPLCFVQVPRTRPTLASPWEKAAFLT